MKIGIFVWLAVLICAGAVVSASADIDGKWVAQMQGPGGQSREVTFNFKADGDKLTGTMSGRAGDREISEGKISGDDISFVMKFSRDGNETRMVYKGKVSGSEIKFTMQREGGDRSFEFVAKKAS